VRLDGVGVRELVQELERVRGDVRVVVRE